MEDPPHTIAVVSGKGGSGKTLFCVAAAQVLASANRKVLLVDADVATAGMSYYLNVSEISKLAPGLAEYLLSDTLEARSICQPLRTIKNVSFVTCGVRRAHVSLNKYTERLEGFFGSELASAHDYIILDCRGGSDEDTIAVCSRAQHILVVAETDTSSIQSTAYLIRLLHESDLSEKILGFALNKVFDDPTHISRAASYLIESQHIGSIPFDLDSTRRYILGKLPHQDSDFVYGVGSILYKVFGQETALAGFRDFGPRYFGELSLRNRGFRITGLMFAMLFTMVAYLGLVIEVLDRLGQGPSPLESVRPSLILVILGLAGMFATLDAVRGILARGLERYVTLLRGRRDH